MRQRRRKKAFYTPRSTRSRMTCLSPSKCYRVPTWVGGLQAVLHIKRNGLAEVRGQSGRAAVYGDLQFALTSRGVPATVRLIHRQQFEDVEESDFERLKAAQRYVFATVRLPRS